MEYALGSHLILLHSVGREVSDTNRDKAIESEGKRFGGG